MCDTVSEAESVVEGHWEGREAKGVECVRKKLQGKSIAIPREKP